MEIQLPRIVGLTAKAGSGKDLAAEWLTRMYGFEQYRMATPIKRALAAMFEFDEELWETDDKDRALPGTYWSPRFLAQQLGTQWGRHIIDENLWVRFLAKHWAGMNDDNSFTFGSLRSLIVSDVRFNNEARWIQQNGGVVIHITRDAVRDVPPHESEEGVNPCLIHGTVDNNSDVDSFIRRFELELERTTRNPDVDSITHITVQA